MDIASEKIIPQLEALLFAYGEPITARKLAAALSAGGATASEDNVRAGLAALAEQLARDDRGLALVTSGDRVQLATKPAVANLVGALVRAELTEELTPASLETLSVVCYGAPAPRSTIDYIRGVNSSFTLRSLLLRGLIERASAVSSAERDSNPAHAGGYVYRPSFDLLRTLGVARSEDLPEYQRFRQLIETTITAQREEHASPASPEHTVA